MIELDRPLKLGELLAETVRFYGERFWACLGLGGLIAGAFVLAQAAPGIVRLAIVSLAVTACYAAASRLVSGDHFGEAWAEVGLRLPVLLVLTFVVSVPVVLALGDWRLLLFAVAWLALTGFSIPATMLERDAEAQGWFGRLGYAMRRSVTLARAEYLHAAGVAAALVLVYWLLGPLLAGLLVSFAENGPEVAFLLAQVVLAPFFFIGLSVLYFEQKARALSSARRP